MTRFPPSRRTAAAPLPRLAGEPNPEAWGYQLFTFASKTGGQNGFFPVDLDGRAIGSPQGSLAVTGSGIYVVDCPLGWTGRLVTNSSREHELFPGARIPEPYTSLSVSIPLPLPGNFPNENATSDSPVTIAIGPRALEYARPGWRFHRWGVDNFSFAPDVVAPNIRGPLTSMVYVKGYDYWSVLYSPGVLQATTTFRIGLWLEYLWPDVVGILGHETSLTPTNGQIAGVAYTIDGATDGNAFFPVFHGGPRSTAPVGSVTKGNYFSDYNPATITANDKAPVIPIGGHAAKHVAFQVQNLLSTGAISDSRFVLYAGVYVA